MNSEEITILWARAFDMYEKAVQESMSRSQQISTLEMKLQALQAGQRKHNTLVRDIEIVLHNIAADWPPHTSTDFEEGFLDG